MRAFRRLGVAGKVAAAAAGLLLPLPTLQAQLATPVAPGSAVNITVTTAAPAPPASIVLGPRHGHVTPVRKGCNHTAGGNIDVAQPTPDVVVITMTGVAVATKHPCSASVASMSYELEQCFEVSFDSPKLKKAKLLLEGRVIGLLRSHACCKWGGTAEQGPGCATVTAGAAPLLTLNVPHHAVACGENLSVNCHDGPIEVPVVPGKYTLHETWMIGAAHSCQPLPCKASSAEFAPDPALDPLWISYWEPFHGAIKKDFGFQITLRVVEDTGAPTNGNGGEKLPPPAADKGTDNPSRER
jgi:hypothetical protein